jgi:hypothetical protein
MGYVAIATSDLREMVAAPNRIRQLTAGPSSRHVKLKCEQPSGLRPLCRLPGTDRPLPVWITSGLPTTRPVTSRFWHVSDKAILRQGLACNYSPYIKVCRQIGNDRMLLNLIAEGKRLSGAERSAEMEHLIHFAQKVTS